MCRNFIVILCFICFYCGNTAYSQISSNPFCANAPTFESAELGFGSFRYHVNWFRFDSLGVYDFTDTDIIANIYGNSGIEPIIIFKCTPRIQDTTANADTTGWSHCEKMLWERIHDHSLPSPETSWFPDDTVAWKDFLTAFVDRYNGDGINDYPGLVYPFRVYQLEVEMTRIWCTNDDDSFPDDYVRYINLSYRTIKEADPDAIVKMAGWGSVDLHMFYLEYIDTDSIPITENIWVKRHHLDTSQIYQERLNSWLYIYNNADYDVNDVHCYGLAEHFPGRAAGLIDLFDSSGTKPLWALEGGGPYRHKAEVFNPINDSGYLSPELVRENAFYVIRYYVGGIGSGFTLLAWNVIPEYDPWGQEFGDLNLLSIDFIKKPAYWVYKGLAELIADYTYTEVIPNNVFWDNPNIIGYKIVTELNDYTFIWNLKDSAFVNLSGLTKQYNYPFTMGDSLWTETNLNSSSIYTFQTSRKPLIFEGSLVSTEVKEDIFEIEEIAIFPNPTSHEINIMVSTELKNASIVIRNNLGQVVHGIVNVSGKEFKINTERLSIGVYYIFIISENNILGKEKFVIN